MGQWLIRKRQFKVTARVAMSQSFILNGAKTGAGFIYPSGGVLVLLTVFGNVMYAIQLWLGSRKWSDQVDHINTPSKSPVDLKMVAYKYQDFPFYRAPQITLEEHESFEPQEWGFNQAVFEAEVERMLGKVRTRMAFYPPS